MKDRLNQIVDHVAPWALEFTGMLIGVAAIPFVLWLGVSAALLLGWQPEPMIASMEAPIFPVYLGFAVGLHIFKALISFVLALFVDLIAPDDETPPTWPMAIGYGLDYLGELLWLPILGSLWWYAPELLAWPLLAALLMIELGWYYFLAWANGFKWAAGRVWVLWKEQASQTAL